MRTPRALPAMAFLVIALLALSAAAWEIDPRWILEATEGFDVIRQTQVNQAAGYGSQVIAWVGTPIALLALLASTRLRTARGAAAKPDLLGLWIAWSMVSAFTGPNITRSLVFTATSAAVVVATRRLGRLDTLWVAQTMTWAFGVYLAVAATVKFGGIAPLALRAQRLTLLSLEANQFGRFASLTVFAGVYVFARASPGPRQNLVRVHAAFSVVLAGGSLVLTGSRAGMAATLLAVGIFLAASRDRRAWLAALVAGLVAIFALTATDTGKGALFELTRDNSSSRDELGTLDGRTRLWPTVLEAIEERPVTGHGFGNDTEVLSPRSAEVGFVVEHAHNLVLHLLLTTGVVGAALLLAAILRAALTVPPANRPWVWSLGAYLAVAGVTESIVRNPDVSLLAITFLTMLAEQPGPNSRVAGADRNV